MIRRTILVLCTTFLLASAVGCGPSALDLKRQQADDAIHVLEPMFGSYYLLGPDATLADARAETARLSNAWTDVVKAADGLEEVDLTDSQAAHDALVKAVADLPDDAKPGEPMRVAVPKMEAFKAAVEKMHEASGLQDLDK